MWDLPGGHVYRGESRREAVDRECLEELGVAVLEATPHEVVTDDPLVELTLFAVFSWIGEPTNTAPEEHDRVAWFSQADLSALHLADERLLALLTEVLV